MSDAEIQPVLSRDPQDAEVTEYQAVSGLAVAGLIAGLLGPLALLHPSLWLVPLVAVLLCGLALKRIADEAPALVGRKAALTGLVVSALCLGTSVSGWLTYRRLVDAEAGRFAPHWFAFLRQGEPQKAFQLMIHPNGRRPLDEGLWDYYLANSNQREEIEAFLAGDEVRALLALGAKADVRYYDTEGQYRDDGADLVEQVYAVTYEEAGQKKSFFVRLTLSRICPLETGRAYWQVANVEGGIRPEAMKGSAEDSQG